jgi:dTDP-4-dehydrorhamnose 3,5-epimerase
MGFEETALDGVVTLTPSVFSDDRGFFYESFNAAQFAETTGLELDFVQDNHSRSIKGVLRGVHYQLPPAAQGKLVRVVEGRVFDVAVDIRRSSSAFGRWFGVELSAENHKQLWVPPGFGHAFLALTSSVQLLYKTTDYYAPDYDRAIRWDDPDLAIAWPLDGVTPLLSDKDAAAPLLADAEVFA